MDGSTASFVFVMALAGLGIGLVLLVRGFGAYRSAGRLADTSTSRIATLAAGEVRITGVIEPAELTLVSLLQDQPCVYYRSSVGSGDEPVDADIGGDGRVVEERSVGFAVRDATGDIRVFPRGARIEAPVRWEDSTGMLGDEPPGLHWRLGSAFGTVDTDRDQAVAALLTVHDTGPGSGPQLLGGDGTGDRGRQTYREARLEPGDEITILGHALPFSDLDDPAGADLGGEPDPDASGGDPVVAADIDAARAAGTLLADPDDAWGNAAIPGFGIGRPVRAAMIDPAATPLPLAAPEAAARAERTFSIAPETLVLASVEDAPLLITYGSPAAAVGRERGRFLVGLLGALLAAASAVVAASVISGGATR